MPKSFIRKSAFTRNAAFLAVSLTVIAGGFEATHLGGSAEAAAQVIRAPHSAKTVSRTLEARYRLFDHGMSVRASHISSSGEPGLQQLLSELGSSSDPSAALGLLPNQVQTLQFPAGDASSTSPAFTEYVVPGAAGACIITEIAGRTTSSPSDGAFTLPAGPVTECGSTAVIGTTGLYQSEQEPNGQWVLFGFVPNGNTSVSAVDQAGQTVTGAVQDNGFVLFSSSEMSTLTFEDSAGHSVVERVS